MGILAKDNDYLKNFLFMATSFYDTMKIIVDPPKKSIFNFFKRATYVSREVLDYYNDPLWDIYNFILEHDLLPPHKNWRRVGYCLFWLTDYEYVKVNLPQEVLDFAKPLLNCKKLCIKKDKDDIYAVVFWE